MQTIKTPQGWAAVLAELEQKQQGVMTHIEQLRGQKHELALDASMGSEHARKRLKATNTELARLAYEVDDLNTAIRSAREQKKASEDTVAAEAERVRQESIAHSMGLYYAEAQQIDDALRLCASRFTAARLNLDRAEALMTAQERAPVNQLRSLWGATLSAAHYGLGEYIQLGPQMSAASPGLPGTGASLS